MLKRINDGVARVEAALAMGMLLLMIVVAFAQAALRNLTLFGASWANAGLEWLSWADFILQKGTLWLAFLGASLAVHADKHVAIDLVPRLVGPRARALMRAMVGLVGCVICFYLAQAFWDAVRINGEEIPAELELLTSSGAVHLCDANAAQLAEAHAKRGAYCIVRGALEIFGIRMDTPGAAFQLIVPAMLIVMSVRMLGNGVHDLMRLVRGDIHEGTDEHALSGKEA